MGEHMGKIPTLRLSGVPINPPRCPRCDVEMRFVDFGPHERFLNLDYHNFACGCGSTARDIVARMS
jgi:hypothetical protein